MSSCSLCKSRRCTYDLYLEKGEETLHKETQNGFFAGHLRPFTLLATAFLSVSAFSISFAQPTFYGPATISCHESGIGQGVLEAQPVADPYPGAKLRVTYYLEHWDGYNWVEFSWTEPYEYDATGNYQPVTLNVPTGYHKVTARYQWLTSQGWTAPVDVETTTYLQLHITDPAQAPQQSPVQVPLQNLPPQMLDSELCYTD